MSLAARNSVSRGALRKNNHKLKMKFDSNKNKVDALFDLIKEKQKHKSIHQRKIQVLEKHFSKAEMFLLKLLPVYEKLDMISNGTQGGVFDNFRGSGDSSTIEALKAQHRKSLLSIKEFYAKFDKKQSTIEQENTEKLNSLKEYKDAFNLK